MEYPKVKKGHIVPKAYLRQWADGQQIGMARVDTSERHVISLRDAGTRGPYYRREQPDGTEIDDAEWSLSHIEDAAAPILRNLEDRWPVSFDEKRVLAEFFAVQLVRGPRAQNWREQVFWEAVEEERQGGRFAIEAAREGASEKAVIDDHEKHLLGKSGQYRSIVRLSRRATSVLGSMIWSLLTTRSPILATADHPVVMRLLGEGASEPNPTPIAGVGQTFEVVVPVSPQAAVLMTWLNEPPLRARPVQVSRHHARSLNSFVLANAEKQWFFKPGTKPPTTTGALLPLSPELLPGYSEQSARACELRHEIGRRLEQQAARERGMTGAERDAILAGRVIDIVGVDLPERSSDEALE